MRDVSLGQGIDKWKLFVQRIKNSPFPKIREFFITQQLLV